MAYPHGLIVSVEQASRLGSLLQAAGHAFVQCDVFEENTIVLIDSVVRMPELAAIGWETGCELVIAPGCLGFFRTFP